MVFEDVYDWYICTDCDRNCQIKCIDEPQRCVHSPDGNKVDWKKMSEYGIKSTEEEDEGG